MSRSIFESRSLAARSVAIARLEARSKKTWSELTRGWREARAQGR